MSKQMERHELIGLQGEIIDAKNKKLIGIKGQIIDETQNLLTIKTETKTKKIIKNQVTMKIISKTKETTIEGKDLVGRPFERIKK